MVRHSLPFVLALILMGLPATAADSVRKLILTRNYKGAAAALMVQAKSGKADAQYQLGVFYREGLGVARDEEKARFWLKKAAAAGVTEANAVLAVLQRPVETDAIRDGVAPKGGQAPLLPLATAQHLPKRAGTDAPWAVELAARGLQTPAGLADPVDSKDIAGETALLVAARLNKSELLQSLLHLGADPSLADIRGWTPVMWAARHGNVEMAAALYGAGAKPGARNIAGADAITVAALACQVQVIPALEQGGESGDPVAATAGRCPNWLENLPKGSSALALALRVGTSMDVESAIALDGAAINTQDEQGYAPLHAAAARGDAKLVSALVNANAKVNSVAKDGSTPLMMAAASGCLACVQRLLPYIDDINAKNIDGESALYLAVRARSLDTVKELRQAGASEASRTIGRDTPEKLATRLGDKALLAAVME